MFWRKSRKDYEADKGTRNKHELKKIVMNGLKPGVIAYVDGEPIGWCAVAPRETYVALERSRILKPVDDQSVWSISCLFVRKDFRRQGVAAKLLNAAVEFAELQGARIVEGYPVEPSNDSMPDPFLWHGVPSAFKAAGFKEVLRRSKSRPIMRYLIANSR